MNRWSIIVLVLGVALPNLACAPVPGEGKFVRVATEEAIIIWDEAAKREHFIRRASFDTNAKDFGFLVPTPGKPELGESDDKTFDLLAGVMQPADRALEADKAARPAAVTVLEQKVVAGFDAAVLEATDAKALQEWLGRHGYPSTPDLVEWLEPYIAGKWKITAFKISADSPKVATSAVRMSFQAEKPFFPYREPAGQRAQKDGARVLVVYVLGEGRFDGQIGATKAWPGQAVWSKNIEKEELAHLLKLAKLPALAGGGGLRLTKFEDHSSPRPGTDELYFSLAGDQSTLAPPPAVWLSPESGNGGYVALMALLVAAAAYGLSRFRRRRNG